MPEVDGIKSAYIFGDDSLRLCLPDQSVDLGVTMFPIYDDLCVGAGIVIRLLDAALQPQHDGACGIDDLDVVASS